MQVSETTRQSCKHRLICKLWLAGILQRVIADHSLGGRLCRQPHNDADKADESCETDCNKNDRKNLNAGTDGRNGAARQGLLHLMAPALAFAGAEPFRLGECPGYTPRHVETNSSFAVDAAVRKFVLHH